MEEKTKKIEINSGLGVLVRKTQIPFQTKAVCSLENPLERQFDN
jgi:hypothetical protein